MRLSGRRKPLPASARPAAPAEARPADRGPAGRWRRAGPAVAAILWLTAAGWGLGAYPLIEPDEGRNGTAAFEVARAGRWLLPTYDGVEFVDKPLLWFDAAALGVRAFGAGELAVRLPSLVFSAATVLLVAWFAGRLYTPGAAWIAANKPPAVEGDPDPGARTRRETRRRRG